MRILLSLWLCCVVAVPVFGQQQTINVGTNPNDGTGDTLRAAFQKTNSNFTDLYTNKQPIDADLTAIAALSPANDDVLQRKAGVWTHRTISQMATDLRTPLDAVYQALDGDLNTIAGLTATNDNFLQVKSGAWTGRTVAQVATDLQTPFDSRYAPLSHTQALSTLTQSGATSGQVPTWNGSAWAPATVSGGSITGVSNAENLTPGTDVTAALQTLIDDNDRVNILRPGTYLLSVTGATAGWDYCILIAKSNFTLYLGDGVILKLDSGEHTDVVGDLAGIMWDNRSDIRICGPGTIDMDAPNQPYTGGYGQSSGSIGIYGRASSAGAGCHRIAIEDVTVKQCFGNPINIGAIEACSDVRISRVNMSGFGEGPQVVNATNVQVANCVMRDSATMVGDGIECSGCRNVSIVGNVLNGTNDTNGSSAVDVYSSQEVVIAGNVVTNWNGVLGVDHYPGVGTCTRVSVTGNAFRNCTNGSSGGDGSSVTFSGNHWYQIGNPGYWLPPTGTTVTITRSGSVATVAHTAHGFEVGERVKISGASETEYNGVFVIATAATNSYTYAVSGSPATPATGTIKDRRYDHQIRYIGDTFSECGPISVGGVTQLEIRGCTLANPVEGGTSACVQVIVDADMTDDLAELRMTDCRFVNSSIGIAVVGTGGAFAPKIQLLNNDFTTVATPVSLQTGGALTNSQGLWNSGAETIGELSLVRDVEHDGNLIEASPSNASANTAYIINTSANRGQLGNVMQNTRSGGKIYSLLWTDAGDIVTDHYTNTHRYATGLDHSAGAWKVSSGYELGTNDILSLTATTATLGDAVNVVVGTTTGTKIGTATTQKIGFWNATPIVQPSGADQAVVSLGNANSEIGGLTISAAYDQTEVQALRDKCEELADDVRALSLLVHAQRQALVDAGLIKGSN